MKADTKEYDITPEQREILKIIYKGSIKGYRKLPEWVLYPPSLYPERWAKRLEERKRKGERRHKIPKLQWKANRQFDEIRQVLFWFKDWLKTEEKRIGFFSAYQKREIIKYQIKNILEVIEQLENPINIAKTEAEEFTIAKAIESCEEDLKAAQSFTTPSYKNLNQNVGKKKRTQLSELEEQPEAFDTLNEIEDGIKRLKFNLYDAISIKKKHIQDWNRKSLLLNDAKVIVVLAQNLGEAEDKPLAEENTPSLLDD